MKNNRRLELVKQRFIHDKGMWFATAFLIFITVIAIGIQFTDADPNAINIEKMMAPPDDVNIFGTDEVGRDYLTRVIYGARVSLLVGILAMITSVTIGVIVGMVAGYFGGLIDGILMRLVDVFCAVPWVIMVTVVSLIFKKGLASIVIVIGCFGWMEISRLVRAETMSAKNREYVQYAELINVPKWKIMMKHVLPTIFPVIITAATGAIANAIMVESSMSFLGIGIQAPMSSWGTLLKTAQTTLSKAPHMAFLPGILIVCTICSFNKLGDLLRLFVEPKAMQEGK